MDIISTDPDRGITTELKTQQNNAGVAKFIAKQKDPQSRVDCQVPLDLMGKITVPPRCGARRSWASALGTTSMPAVARATGSRWAARSARR